MIKIIDLFNFQLLVKKTKEMCPFQSVDALTKSFIKNILFIVTMLAFVVFFTCVYLIVDLLLVLRKRFSRRRVAPTGDKENQSPDCNANTTTTSSSSFSSSSFNSSPTLSSPSDCNKLRKSSSGISFGDRLVLCFVRILMFGYKNISLFAIVSMNCVEVNGESVLYISGDVRCYQHWQWLIVTVFVVWIIPFPIALVLAYRLFKKCIISRFFYMFCLIFPPAAFYFTFCSRKSRKQYIDCRIAKDHSLRDELSDIFEEPYRTVQYQNTTKLQQGLVVDLNNKEGNEQSETMYWWTAWRLHERLVVAALVTFIVEPLLRMCVVAPVMICLVLVRFQVKPYKESMTLLSLADLASYVFLIFFVVDNLFRSFTYTFDLPLQYPINKGIQTLNVLEVVLTPLTMVALFAVSSILDRFLGRN